MRYKVAELEGPLLDAAVALAEGWRHEWDTGHHVWMCPLGDGAYSAEFGPRPWSADWALGGPLIARERIATEHYDDGEWWAWIAGSPRTRDDPEGRGPTPLIAAMRAYVASKLGEEVDL